MVDGVAFLATRLHLPIKQTFIKNEGRTPRLNSRLRFRALGSAPSVQTDATTKPNAREYRKTLVIIILLTTELSSLSCSYERTRKQQLLIFFSNVKPTFFERGRPANCQMRGIRSNATTVMSKPSPNRPQTGPLALSGHNITQQDLSSASFLLLLSRPSRRRNPTTTTTTTQRSRVSPGAINRADLNTPRYTKKGRKDRKWTK